MSFDLSLSLNFSAYADAEWGFKASCILRLSMTFFVECFGQPSWNLWVILCGVLFGPVVRSNAWSKFWNFQIFRSISFGEIQVHNTFYSHIISDIRYLFQTMSIYCKKEDFSISLNVVAETPISLLARSFLSLSLFSRTLLLISCSRNWLLFISVYTKIFNVVQEGPAQPNCFHLDQVRLVRLNRDCCLNLWLRRWKHQWST